MNEELGESREQVFLGNNFREVLSNSIQTSFERGNASHRKFASTLVTVSDANAVLAQPAASTNSLDGEPPHVGLAQRPLPRAPQRRLRRILHLQDHQRLDVWQFHQAESHAEHDWPFAAAPFSGGRRGEDGPPEGVDGSGVATCGVCSPTVIQEKVQNDFAARRESRHNKILAYKLVRRNST